MCTDNSDRCVLTDNFNLELYPEILLYYHPSLSREGGRVSVLGVFVWGSLSGTPPVRLRVGGAHPTGMHSRFRYEFWQKCNYNPLSLSRNFIGQSYGALGMCTSYWSILFSFSCSLRKKNAKIICWRSHL